MRQRSDLLRVGVVVPCRGDEPGLAATLASLAEFTRAGDPLVVVIADGDGQAGAIAKKFGVAVMPGHFPGRGWAVAQGVRYLLHADFAEWRCDLIFIAHADMTCQAGTRARIIDFMNRHPQCPGGSLGHKIAAHGWPYRLLEWGNRWRAQVMELPYGDQGQFCRARILVETGGFPARGCLEDLELALTMRRHGAVAYLDYPATISPRHWNGGMVRTTLRNRAVAQAYAEDRVMALACHVGVVAPAPVALVLVAKLPEAGRVKTRMIGPLTAGGAAAVHGEFMRYFCAVGAELANLGLITPILYMDMPDNGMPAVPSDHFLPPCWRLLVQSEGNLSRRLGDAARVLFRRGHRAVIFVAADSPDMRAEDIINAARGLTQHDTVMIPARDGGYTLLGMGHSGLGLLENIAWGTAVVAEQTRRQARIHHLSLMELPVMDDVDTFDALHGLLGRLEKSRDARQRELGRRLTDILAMKGDGT